MAGEHASRIKTRWTSGRCQAEKFLFCCLPDARTSILLVCIGRLRNCVSCKANAVSSQDVLAAQIQTSDSGAGFADIAVRQCEPATLALAEDITKELLAPAIPEGPSLSKADLKLQKGAVVSFQSWEQKFPDTIGLALGEVPAALKIVASREHSMRSLMEHPKVLQLCRQEKLKPCGFLFGPKHDKSTAEPFLQQMLQEMRSAVCVCVARHSKWLGSGLTCPLGKGQKKHQRVWNGLEFN